MGKQAIVKTYASEVTRIRGWLDASLGVEIIDCPVVGCPVPDWMRGYLMFTRDLMTDGNGLFHVEQPPPRTQALWQPAEIYFLMACWPMRWLPSVAVGAILRRSEKSVRVKASRLGLAPRRKRKE